MDKKDKPAKKKTVDVMRIPIGWNPPPRKGRGK